jgi:hypothetical protein
METKITTEDGCFVVHVRREFTSMEEAQRYAATVQFGGEKVDKRKLRPRAFDEFCEYLPDSTSTLKRAQCNICVKLHGHVSGVNESTFTLEWTVGQDHQNEVKERENNEASRHLRTKVKTVDGVMTVKDLHEMYRRDPDKFATAAAAPPHQPVMTSCRSAYDLETAIDMGRYLAGEVNRIAFMTAYAVIAMQDPVPQIVPTLYWKVNVQKHAEMVLAKHGITLFDRSNPNSHYNCAEMEKFLCTLPRSEAVDIALHIFQKIWYLGVRKAAKNKDYLPHVLSRFKQACTAHEEAMKLVRLAFGRTAIYDPWFPSSRTEQILKILDMEKEEDSDE